MIKNIYNFIYLFILQSFKSALQIFNNKSVVKKKEIKKQHFVAKNR